MDLDHPYLLATDGLEPDESDPQFHQQIVCAVLTNLGLFRGGVREKCDQRSPANHSVWRY